MFLSYNNQCKMVGHIGQLLQKLLFQQVEKEKMVYGSYWSVVNSEIHLVTGLQVHFQSLGITVYGGSTLWTLGFTL